MKKRSGIWALLLVVAIAIANELRKAPGARTWHDQLWGVLPYDFRFPTWVRLKQTMWNPHSDRIFVPQAFGIGWTVNLGGLVKHIGRADS